MPGLQARSALRSAHPLFFINKLVSLAAFILLLTGGWVIVSFLKSDVLDRWRTGASERTAAQQSSAAPAQEASQPQVSRELAPARLVYSCTADKDFYHLSTHLPAGSERTALSEEGAAQRGLKKCKACFPE